LKKKLDEKHIQYKVSNDFGALKEVGFTQIPVLFYNNTYYGYDDAMYLLSDVNGRNLMSDAKFYESYSRYNDDDKAYESWEQAVDRVMDMHKKKYKDILDEELLSYMDEVSETYKDKLFLGAQRALQFGGEQLEKHNSRLYNCFDKNTEFVTNKGNFKFKDFKDGESVIVKTHIGNWKRAIVKSYGEQDLYKVKFKKGSNNNGEVLVTKNHRWILKDGKETTNLSVGDELYQIPDAFMEFNWTVASIEHSHRDTVWCLEVEDDKSFTLSNGIITGNCSASHCDRPNFFGGMTYLLLCGAGVGFSVQKQHIAKLPNISKRSDDSTTYIVDDSIEGWSSAIDVLMSSYFTENQVYPEFVGKKVYFDYSNIRSKGSFISGGFKAPGAEPLRKAIDLIESKINSEIKNGENRLRSIVLYDIAMYIADAVISGGKK
jgi:hypothetical protein